MTPESHLSESPALEDETDGRYACELRCTEPSSAGRRRGALSPPGDACSPELGKEAGGVGQQAEWRNARNRSDVD